MNVSLLQCVLALALDHKWKGYDSTQPLYSRRTWAISRMLQIPSTDCWMHPRRPWIGCGAMLIPERCDFHPGRYHPTKLPPIHPSRQWNGGSGISPGMHPWACSTLPFQLYWGIPGWTKSYGWTESHVTYVHIDRQRIYKRVQLRWCDLWGGRNTSVSILQLPSNGPHGCAFGLLAIPNTITRIMQEWNTP